MPERPILTMNGHISSMSRIAFNILVNDCVGQWSQIVNAINTLVVIGFSVWIHLTDIPSAKIG